jgi:hypothetical protein
VQVLAFAQAPASVQALAVALVRQYVAVETWQRASMVLIALVALAAVGAAVRASARSVRKNLEGDPHLR